MLITAMTLKRVMATVVDVGQSFQERTPIIESMVMTLPRMVGRTFQRIENKTQDDSVNLAGGTRYSGKIIKVAINRRH